MKDQILAFAIVPLVAAFLWSAIGLIERVFTPAVITVFAASVILGALVIYEMNRREWHE